MDRYELALALWSAANRKAHAHGVQFGSGADTDIRRLAEMGADRMINQMGEPSGGDPAVEDAEAAFEKLVDEMFRAAGEIEGYSTAHPMTIGEQTLAEALSRLCPLFPIC